MNELTPKQKGLNTELHCISYFSDCGFLVSTPYGDNGRYDLIVDVNGHLLRVQVKTASGIYDDEGKLSAIKFSCKSARINTKESYVKRYTKDEIDYFATYWNNRVFVVPVEETSSEKVLHISLTKNNQDELVSFIDDYTIEKQWKKFFDNSVDFCEPAINNIEIDWVKTEANHKIEVKNKCKRCGKPIAITSEYCHECSAFLHRKVDRPGREELKQVIRTTTFVDAGKKYGVSDKAIVKWCKAEGLPYRKIDIKAIPDSEWINI